MSNQQPLTMSRRRFLTGAAALAAAPLLAGLWPKAALAQAISEALPQFIVLRQAQRHSDRRPLGRVRGHRARRQDGRRAAGAGRSVSE